MALRYTRDGLPIYEPDGSVLVEAFWDRSEFSMIQGPIGSGTSSMCCHKIWAIANEQEPDVRGLRDTKWAIIRKTYKELETTTAKTWLEWFPEDKFGQFRWSVPMRQVIEQPHHSGDGTRVRCEILMVAIEDEETAETVAASLELTGFFLNEAQFHSKQVVDEFLSRCGRYPSTKNGPGATWFGGFGDMNAPVEGHWVPYMRGDIAMPREWSDDQKRAMTLPKGWKMFLQPAGLIEQSVEGEIVYLENPDAENQKHLKKSYLQQIQGKTKEWIDRRVMNRTGLYSEGKSVYEQFVESVHVARQDIAFNREWELWIGLDFGRDPAAVFAQCINGNWRVLAELIGDNESAELFAPRVKRLLATSFPGARIGGIGGDPRGADGTQATETTAYDVFRKHGLPVQKATEDNDPELRRSTVDAVLSRRDGLLVSPNCLVLKTGLAGGYHYPKLKGVSGMFAPKPRKNRYSHVVEAMENVLLIGGEGAGVTRGVAARPAPMPVNKRRLRNRRRVA